jgi:methionine sulfoxide reductase heme-binding subunit
MTPSFRKALQAVLHLAIALPLALLAWRWSGVLLNDADPRLAGLSVEPVDYTIDYLGLWALRLLWLTLAISPLRQITGWNWLGAWRRPLGLWTFTYALLHLSVYFGLDQAGDLGLLVEDVIKHNFILLGMSALLLILPLALTSTRGMIKRLGARRWQNLHRLIYLAAALASVHFILRVKGFQWEPWIYAGLLALLLAWRFKPVRALIGR